MGCLWGGGGDRVRMRVCTPCGAGGVCVRACGVCAWGWCGQRETQPGAKDDAVCVCVCVKRGVFLTSYSVIKPFF